MSGLGVITLEIALRPTSARTIDPTRVRVYELTLRLSLDGRSSQDPLEKVPKNAPARRVTINTEELLKVAADERAYGQKLTGMLFSSPDALEAFRLAYTARAKGSLLQVLIRLAISDTTLHDLHWEWLCDPRFPERSDFLATDRTVALARYHYATTTEPRERGNYRALIVAASPQNLNEYELEPFPAADRSAKLARLLTNRRTIQEQVLPAMQVDLLTSTDTHQQERTSACPPSSRALIETLRSARPALVYIMCHGAFTTPRSGVARNTDAEPRLILEGEDGNVELVDAGRIATYLRQSTWAPDLVVLASCESAGAGYNPRALTALAPQLLEAGIGVVVAMFGQISLAAAERFVEVFFDELRMGHAVGTCVAEARAQLLSINDYHWWRPVLFTRMQDGAALRFATPQKVEIENKGGIEVVRGEPRPSTPWVTEYHRIINGNSQLNEKDRKACRTLLDTIATLLRIQSPTEHDRAAFINALDDLSRYPSGFYYQLLKRIQRPPSGSGPVFAYSYRVEASRRVSASGN